jgi:hypothetical protein
MSAKMIREAACFEAPDPYENEQASAFVLSDIWPTIEARTAHIEDLTERAHVQLQAVCNAKRAVWGTS